MHTQRRLTSLLTLIFGIMTSQALFAQSPTMADEQSENTAAATVNINSADAASLAEALDGVGLSRAKSIIEWRESNGPFEDPYDLVQIRGISERIVSLNEDRISVADSADYDTE